MSGSWVAEIFPQDLFAVVQVRDWLPSSFRYRPSQPLHKVLLPSGLCMLVFEDPLDFIPIACGDVFRYFYGPRFVVAFWSRSQPWLQQRDVEDGV